MAAPHAAHTLIQASSAFFNAVIIAVSRFSTRSLFLADSIVYMQFDDFSILIFAASDSTVL